MKRIQNIIIFLLCLCLVGFFANFAQNDYGMAIVPFAMLLIGVLMLELLRHTIINYKKLGFSLYIMIFFPVLSLFIYIYDKGELFIIISSIVLVLGFLYNLLIVPIIIYFYQKKSSEPKVDFKNYFELIFLCLIPIGIYLKSNHMIGAGILTGTSMLVILPYFHNMFIRLKSKSAISKGVSLFQIMIYLYISLSVLGTVFKIQHWPGASLIAVLALSVLLISIIIVIYQKIILKKSTDLFVTVQPITKIVFVTFCVTGSWLMLRNLNLAPSVYSDELPKAMQYFKANENDVTEEGIALKHKLNVYDKNYKKFIQERNIEEQ